MSAAEPKPPTAPALGARHADRYASLPTSTRMNVSAICADAARIRRLSNPAVGAMEPHLARATLARLRQMIDDLDADLAAQGFAVGMPDA